VKANAVTVHPGATGVCTVRGLVFDGGVIGILGTELEVSDLILDSSPACVSPKLRVSERLTSAGSVDRKVSLIWPVLKLSRAR